MDDLDVANILDVLRPQGLGRVTLGQRSLLIIAELYGVPRVSALQPRHLDTRLRVRPHDRQLGRFARDLDHLLQLELAH